MKEVVEKRPPMLKLGAIVAGVVILSAVSALAVVEAGDGDDAIAAGVPDGTKLTASASLRVTKDGAVVDALDVKGNIVVLANDVTIKRTKVTTSGAHAIRVGSGSTGLTVEDSTLECSSAKGRSGVAWNNYTATRVAVGDECRRGFVYGPNTTITDSYWGDEPFEDQKGRPSPTTTVEGKTSSWTTPTTAAPTTTAPPATTTTQPDDLAVAPSRPRPADGVPVKDTCRNADNLANGTQPRRGFPTDATTGPQVDGYDETFMSPSGKSGTWVISRDGATVDGVYHNGAVEVTGDNVTIRNSIICGQGNMMVSVEGQNLTIENSIVRGERGKVYDGETGAPCQATVGYGKFTIRRSELTYCIDGLKASGSTRVYDSYFHDAYTNRHGDGDGTHNDTVQSVESPMPELIFEGNAVYQDPCTSNRHFQLAPLDSQPATDTLRVDRNFFYGMKGFNLDRGFKVINGSIAGNTFAGSATSGPFSTPMYSGDGMGSVARRGNVFEQSGGADGDMPNGYQCVP